jgi:hypothetical protein
MAALFGADRDLSNSAKGGALSSPVNFVSSKPRLEMLGRECNHFQTGLRTRYLLPKMRSMKFFIFSSLPRRVIAVRRGVV